MRGDNIEIFPVHYEDRAWRVSLFGDEVESIAEFDPLTGERTCGLTEVTVFPSSHYVTPRPTITAAISGIKEELRQRLDWFTANGKLLEAQRLEERTRFDLEMLETVGHCKSIENYSRYLTGRAPGEPPPTLFEYLPEDALVIIDEVARHRAPDRRHVPRRLRAQEHARRIRFPPAVLRRQPSAQIRGMGADARPDRVRLGHARSVGDASAAAASSSSR